MAVWTATRFAVIESRNGVGDCTNRVNRGLHFRLESRVECGIRTGNEGIQPLTIRSEFAQIDILNAADIVLEVGDGIEAKLRLDKRCIPLIERVRDFTVSHLVRDELSFH